MLTTSLNDADTEETIEVVKDAFHHPAHALKSLESTCILRVLIN